MPMQSNEPVTFLRDCEAALIPAGDTGTIPKGAEGMITQALGGSYTVYIQGNLFRIDGKDADAIGKEPEPTPELPDDASEEDVEQLVWDQMRRCYDPEIPINIVELGLVYRCDIGKRDDGSRKVSIDMTLTAPGCGMGDILAYDVREKVKQVPTVEEVEVEIVFDPPWSFEMMSDAAKLQTGMM
ncbi:putative Fe-S cluster assembly protein SufT [Sediminicurvatus halobius]|uniref:Putative Fe-S cluster assembly protein SufT n=1 Tax=Sediminicurvatus halobius TaxID=2182432 RepID=A0A2U2MZH4_9GAMM|nr:putative Fe-S cluster assembly protein SufT [Spiribacter halobius]PWG62149.1 putative Fe-S cluster assembly protein SufT [Spiribacter halobius]UEX77165.1 putative Fe-S cluster assembly protein SufT [Spiribacter halobius]